MNYKRRFSLIVPVLALLLSALGRPALADPIQIDVDRFTDGQCVAGLPSLCPTEDGVRPVVHGLDILGEERDLLLTLLDNPVAVASVDMAYSIGVLHHTADPAKAFSQLAKTVKAGGQLAVWVYTCHVTDRRWLPVLEFFHEITRAVEPSKLYEIIEKWAPLVRDAYAEEWGPLMQIIRVSISKDDAECVSDTMDWHAPKFRFWHTEGEVKGWFKSAGYTDLVTGDFPVTVIGRRA